MLKWPGLIQLICALDSDMFNFSQVVFDVCHEIYKQQKRAMLL
jgi:hypothetical protein